MALWTPAQITTALWLDASDSGTITESSGAVSQWRDKSGNTRHFSQGTGSLQPTLTAAGLGGLAVVDFAGDYLVSDDAASTWTFLHDATGASVFLVAKAGTGSDPNAGYVFLGTSSISSSVTGYDLFYDDRSSLPVNNSARAYVSRGSSPAAIDHVEENLWTPNAYQIVAALTDPSEGVAADRSRLFMNGGTEQTGNTSNALLNTGNSPNTLRVGASGANTFVLTGGIAEVVVVSGVVDTTTRQLVEGYLAWKWGLEGNLASGHPYESAAPEIVVTDYPLAAADGTFALTGQAVSLANGYGLSASAGAYVLTGQEAGETVARSIAAAAGSYGVTGQGVGINQGKNVTAGAGAFAATGNPAALNVALSIAAEAGAYAITGNDASTAYGFSTAYDLGALVGAFTWTGAAVVVRKGFTLAAGREQFPVIGRSNLMNRQRTLVAHQGQIEVSGNTGYLRAPGGRRRFALIT